MYSEAMDSAHEFLIRPVKVVPGRDDLTAIGVAAYGQYSATMDHLTCFAGGMLGLGSRLLGREKDFETGVNVSLRPQGSRVRFETSVLTARGFCAGHRSMRLGLRIECDWYWARVADVLQR